MMPDTWEMRERRGRAMAWSAIWLLIVIVACLDAVVIWLLLHPMT